METPQPTPGPQSKIRSHSLMIFSLGVVSLLLVSVHFLIAQNQWCALRGAAFNSRHGHVKPHVRGVVIAMAFNHKEDPQRFNVVHDPEKYIAEWSASVHEHPHMQAVIIGNMFTKDFRLKHATSQLSFVHVDPKTHDSFTKVPKSLDRMINDQRFFSLEWYVNQSHSKYDYVITTDLHDVRFLHDPFPYMQATDQVMGSPQIYAAEEHPFPERAAAIAWPHLKAMWKVCFKQKMPKTHGVYFNVGIFGAKIQVFRRLLKQVTDLLLTTPTRAICDMSVYNKILTEKYNDDVVYGYPFHTKFGGFEDHSAAFIKHK